MILIRSRNKWSFTMQIENKILLNYLTEIDEVLEKKIRIIGIGGTALTLLEIKTSTRDIDIELLSEDKNVFDKAKALVPSGFRIDIFTDGMILAVALPSDYEKKIIPIENTFKNIDLFALYPLDIIVSKVDRSDERDLQDIEDIIHHYNYSEEQIRSRAKQVGLAANEEIYWRKVEYIIKNYL